MTVDLDVLVRSDLLAFLRAESETRGATILYATHIFDGISAFPTHVTHMRDGAFVGMGDGLMPWPPAAARDALVTTATDGSGSMLHDLALQWLKEDREVRKQAEAEGKKSKTRGARKVDVPTDSETFYKK